MFGKDTESITCFKSNGFFTRTSHRFLTPYCRNNQYRTRNRSNRGCIKKRSPGITRSVTIQKQIQLLAFENSITVEFEFCIDFDL